MGFLSTLFSSRRSPEFQTQVELDWYDVLIMSGASEKQAVQICEENRVIAQGEVAMLSPFGRPENYWAPQDDNPSGVRGAAWPPGAFSAPTQYGQAILFSHENDTSIDMYLHKIRKEGVRDSDIAWFWDMDCFERIMTMRLFTLIVGAFWNSRCRETQDSRNASLWTRKVHPCFGNPDDLPGSPHAPIPVELKRRIEVYSRNRRLADAGSFHQEIEGSMSFNSLVRREITAGNL